jgi:hypothetical protein
VQGSLPRTLLHSAAQKSHLGAPRLPDAAQHVAQWGAQDVEQRNPMKPMSDSKSDPSPELRVIPKLAPEQDNDAEAQKVSKAAYHAPQVSAEVPRTGVDGKFLWLCATFFMAYVLIVGAGVIL